jgi:cation diffusion facilitator family transporter
VAASEKYADARKAAWLGIVGSGLLGALKLAAGIIGHSSAVVADAIESLADSIASAVVLIGIKISLQPPDREHPYGHDRAEGVAGSTVATLMLVSGVLIAESNIRALMVPHDDDPPHLYTVWFMILSVIVKGALFAYKLRVAKKTGSVSVQADAWNDFLDVFSGIIVLIGLAFAIFFSAPWADHAAAVAVAAIILSMSAKLYAQAGRAQMDQQAPPEFLDGVRKSAQAEPGVAGVEKLLARRAGLMYFVDLHLEVAPTMPVSEAHKIGHNVKDRIMKDHEDVADVLVHLEPSKKSAGAPASLPAKN